MHLFWEAEEDYPTPLREGLTAALAHTPREHLLRLTGIYAYDEDPAGERLGVYLRDHRGCRIELYLQAHLRLVQGHPQAERLAVLQLAHTLFHEVGHHLTLTLNPRKKPSKKRAAVTQTLEDWAEQYAQKRMERFLQSLTQPAESTPPPGNASA